MNWPTLKSHELQDNTVLHIGDVSGAENQPDTIQYRGHRFNMIPCHNEDLGEL
jgi:hypothetical protein